MSHWFTPCAGNGLTDFYTMSAAYVEMQCTGASVFPVQTISYVDSDIDIYWLTYIYLTVPVIV